MHHSIIIPAYNEADSLAELCKEVRDVMGSLSCVYEVIIVDDGSTDGTTDVIRELRGEFPEVRSVELIRNYGKSAAYSAGFDAAQGDVVITVDADLQDDPREIPKMLEALEGGLELVVGWKQNRLGNEPSKATASKFFNFFLYLLFGIRLHDSNCGFRVMWRSVAMSLNLHGDFYRFIPELAHVQGYRVGEVPVQHRKRKYGRSKYGPKRFFTGLMDLITVRFVTGFKQKPLHFFGVLAVFFFTAGLGLEGYVLTMKLLGSAFQTHLAALIVGVLLILLGVQVFVTGLVGEMLAARGRQMHYIQRPEKTAQIASGTAASPATPGNTMRNSPQKEDSSSNQT